MFARKLLNYFEGRTDTYSMIYINIIRTSLFFAHLCNHECLFRKFNVFTWQILVLKYYIELGSSV